MTSVGENPTYFRTFATDRKQVDFGRENSLFPLILIQVKSAAKRTVFGLKDKREKAFLPFKTQLFHIQVVRYAAKESEAGAKTGYVDKALSADKLKTARAVTLAGAITGNTTFDGSKDISIETSLKPLEEQDIPELSLSKIKDAGTAAACNTGTEAGQIPVIGEGGKLNEALIPQQTLTTDNVNEGKKIFTIRMSE